MGYTIMLLWELLYIFTPLIRWQLSQYGRGFIPGSLAIGSESHWRPRRTGSRSREAAGNQTAFILCALLFIMHRVSLPGIKQTDAAAYLSLYIFMPWRLGATAALPFLLFYKVNFYKLANLYTFFTKIPNFTFHYKKFRNYNLEYSCTFITKML
jgi:hypothetical protein